MNKTHQIPVLAVDAAQLANLNRSVFLGINERFTINVENTSTKRQKVALLGAFYDTSKADITDGASVGGAVKELEKNGFPVAAVAFDGDTAIAGGGSIKFSSGNPSATISSFVKYLRTNPRLLKSMLITANDQNAFDANLEITKANPMGHGKTITVDLNQYLKFEQNLTDRIIIDFAEQELEICDDLVMAINIPGNTKMSFNFRF